MPQLDWETGLPVRMCSHCSSRGHNIRTCAKRFRDEEARACGHPVPCVHTNNNKEELARVRALTATRIREEALQERARALQESENRARERAEARQAQARQALERQVQVRQALEIERQALEGEALERGLVLLEAEQRLEAALEGAARFNAGAWEARGVELARQERDRIAWWEREGRIEARIEALADQPLHPPERDEDERMLYNALQGQQQEILDQGDAEAVQNLMRRHEAERQEEERHIQGLPEEQQAELRQGWEEERQAELRRVRDLQMQDPRRRPGWFELPPNMDEIPLADRWRVWRDYERHGAQPNMVTDNELARMVALPVLRETVVETTECPICIEDLGEVGKTVLKCGHTLCVSCFLQQMMRATAESRARDCKCPVCRVSYIM